MIIIIRYMFLYLVCGEIVAEDANACCCCWFCCWHHNTMTINKSKLPNFHTTTETHGHASVQLWRKPKRRRHALCIALLLHCCALDSRSQTVRVCALSCWESLRPERWPRAAEAPLGQVETSMQTVTVEGAHLTSCQISGQKSFARNFA